MDGLSDLIAACRSADTDKVTERKKQLEKIRQLLNKNIVQRALDKNSDQKSTDSRYEKKVFGWDNLFKICKNLMWHEVEALQKAKNADSTAMIKKKQEVSGLVKCVVRLADQRGGHRLKSSDVVAHVLAIMKDNFACSCFGVDLTSLLLKEILCVRKYWCELNQATWHELLCLYSKLLKDPPPKFDRAILARIVHSVIKGATHQCDVKGRKILPIISDYFADIKQERSISVLEHMVSALNTLAQGMAVDGRQQVCRLGESVAVPLLFTWKNRPSDVLKDELVEFFQLQLSVHHPRGAREVGAGAFAVNWELWKSHLRKLYEAVYNDLQEFGGRHKFAKGTREGNKCQLQESFVNLAADVCHQLFSEQGSSVDVTQVSFLQDASGAQQVGGPAKKRRLESGWQALREVYTQHGRGYLAIPWLQLLCCLLQKYPTSLPEEEYSYNLSALIRLVHDSKKLEVTRWGLKCLMAVATSQTHNRKNMTEFTLESCQLLWKKTWSSALRLISLQHEAHLAFYLLTTIMEHRLLMPDKDVWNLFIPTVTKPSQAALVFLAAYISSYDLPESYKPQYLANALEYETINMRHPLRHLLLEWLLPEKDDVSEAATFNVAPPRANCPSEVEVIRVELLANILVALIKRDTRTGQSAALHNCDDISTPKSPFLTIEDTHLTTCFCGNILDQCQEQCENEVVLKKSSLIQSLERKLMELLVRDCNHMLEITETEVHSVEAICRTVCCTLSLLCQLFAQGCYSLEQLSQLQVVEKLQELITKMCDQMCEVIRKDGMAALSSVLAYLEDLCGRECERPETADIVRAVLQPKLVQQFVSFLKEKPKMNRVGSSTSGQHGSQRKCAANDMDDLDLDFADSATPTPANGFDDEFDEATQRTESQESDGFSTVDSGSESLLVASQLTDKERLKLQIVRLLCKWCAGKPPGCSTVVLKCDVTLNAITDHLLDLLEEDYGWDSSRAFDLQMMKIIIEELSGEGRVVSEVEMECFLDTLRSVCKNHRKDQDICSLVLNLLQMLVTHLCAESDSPVSQSVKESRSIALGLVGVFWKFAKEGQYGRQTRMAVARCMSTFAQRDSDRSWAYWKPKPTEPGQAVVAEFLHDKYVEFVTDSHHGIRLLVAQSIRHLFVANTAEKQPLPLLRQNEVFDLTYSLLQNTFATSSRLSPDEQVDEAENRTSSTLLTLTAIACHSAICEKKAVFAVCQMAKERNLPATQVVKVLGKIASHLQYKDVQHFMTSHLAYIVQQWVDSNYDVMELPHELIGYKSQLVFFKEHFKTIVPFLVMSKNYETVTKLSKHFDTDTSQLLELCIIDTLVHILPLFAVSKAAELRAGAEVQKRAQYASSCYDALLKHVQQQVIEQQIVRFMPELVVKVLMTLHNTDRPTGGATRSEDPEPNPPCFDTATVECTLAYISHCHGARSLVSGMAKQHQDGIQKVLLALSKALSDSHIMHEKCRIQRLYRLVVKLLLKEFHEQLGGSWAFVLRNTIHTLLHNVASIMSSATEGSGLDTRENDFILVCLEILTSICQVGIENCPNELGRFLPTVVGTLVALVNMEGDIGQQGERLLNMLLVENASSLRASIAALDALPDRAVFQAARTVQQRVKYAGGKFTLREEVVHFLQAGGRAARNLCDRQEGLKHLRQLLASSNKKHQLLLLLNECQADEEGSVLVLLLHELIELAKNPVNNAVAQEAARCLGEIGPAYLHVIAVKGPVRNIALENATKKYSDQPDKQKYCLIFHLLDEYLIDPSVALVEAASDVLKKVLSTRVGSQFYTEYKDKVNDNLFCFLHPFKPGKKKPINLPDQDSSMEHFKQQLGDPEWWTPSHCEHGLWMRNLVKQLIECGALHDEILRLLMPICQVKPAFCEEVLPLLIHDILSHGTDEHRQFLSMKINEFFAKQCGKASHTKGSVTSSADKSAVAHMKKRSVETMLKVVQYLRVQQRPSSGRGKVSTVWENNFWLELDYLQLAEAALSCSAYFTTILYAEIWCSIQRDHKVKEWRQMCRRQNSQRCHEVLEQFSQDSPLEALAAQCSGSRGVHDVMLEAYRSIGDPDAVYGCGSSRIAEAASRIKMYEHEANWSRALCSYDVILNDTEQPREMQAQVMQALYRQGSSHLLDTYLAGIHWEKGESELKEMQYQAALRNTQWHLQTPTRVGDIEGFHEAVYTALTALREKDTGVCSEAMNIARLRTISKLQGISLESARSCYPCLSQLHCITIVDDAQRVVEREMKFEELLEKWSVQDAILQNDFEFIEPVLSMRCSLLNLIDGGKRGGARDVMSAHVTQRLMEHMEKFAICAREASRYQVAEGLMYRLRQLETTLGEGGVEARRWSWRVEEACMFWARGEATTARHLLQRMCHDMQAIYNDDLEARKWFPICLSMLGDWLAETRAENPKVVMEDYLSKAVEVHETVNSKGEDRLDAYLALARYADGQYQSIVNHMKSSSYEEKQNLYKKAREEIDQLIRMGDKNSRYVRTLEKQWSIDDQEEKNLVADKRQYLQCAVENYIKCLQHGDKHDLRVFRLTSLWFDNTGHCELNALIRDSLPSIKSHKFLSLMYQLAARMGNTQHAGLFHSTLDRLIERTCREHPHHTLYIVLALAHANKDDEMLAGRLSRKASGRLARASNSQDSQAHDQDRVLAAKDMVARLKRTERGRIVQDMETLCLAYIHLANFNVDQYKKETRPINLPTSLVLTQLKDLTNVAMPTLQVAVDPQGRYDNITYVKEFRPTFKLAGGINLPKIISCVGSDGVARRQLVKGRDDLRQDAVMQQVFGMVNNLLNKEQQTRARKLAVRQYKVIPLSQRSGLLEWCEGTLPVGEYLIGANGAHQRYRPQDYKALECRREMTEAIERVKNNKAGLSKYEAFIKACQNFQPVFRHFFLENFPDPADWYQRRLAYTRSVATNSIVGYILGLGDRHVQNILIDTHTAEMVHIDLGVAFEQGKILPTPETVPFRLTRDVVDGMGVAGVEGVFRRCCEKTMAVMHQNQEALLTILEVLLYDPLYAWTLSPERAALLQQTRDLDATSDLTSVIDVDEEPETRSDESRENVNKVAGRVLLRLQQKLQGLEEGVQLSVNGQVNKLIHEARDPQNLCKLFPGWQPYI